MHKVRNWNKKISGKDHHQWKLCIIKSHDARTFPDNADIRLKAWPNMGTNTQRCQMGLYPTIFMGVPISCTHCTKIKCVTQPKHNQFGRTIFLCEIECVDITNEQQAFNSIWF